MAGYKSPPRLPAEGGGGVVLWDQVYVLRLQRPQEADHPLGVFAGYGAAQVRQGGNAPAAENGRPWIYGGLPLAVPLEGDLDLFVAGFQAL